MSPAPTRSRSAPGPDAPDPDAPGTGGTDPERRVLRRAATAGTVVAVGLAVALSVAVLVAGGGGALGLAAVVSGLTVGALTASGWLLLSVLFDLFADRVPAVRRLWWALGLGALGFIGPVFILGALAAADG